MASWALILNEMENTLSIASASCVYVMAEFMLMFVSHEKEWAALGVDMMGWCCNMLFLSTEILAFWG